MWSNGARGGPRDKSSDTLTAVIGKWALSVNNLILPLKVH